MSTESRILMRVIDHFANRIECPHNWQILHLGDNYLGSRCHNCLQCNPTRCRSSRRLLVFTILFIGNRTKIRVYENVRKLLNVINRHASPIIQMMRLDFDANYHGEIIVATFVHPILVFYDILLSGNINLIGVKVTALYTVTHPAINSISPSLLPQQITSWSWRERMFQVLMLRLHQETTSFMHAVLIRNTQRSCCS